MPARRHLLATGVAILGSLAGCSGAVGDATSHEATAGSIPPSVLDETGYEKAEVKPVDQSRTFSVGGVSRTVEVTNRRAVYEKTIDLPIGSVRAANVAVVSTPSVRILGRQYNPIAGMDDEQFSERVEQHLNGVGGLERVGEDTVRMLGSEVTVGRYDGVFEPDSIPIPVDVVAHVVDPVQDGDDYVTAVAVYATLIADSERGLAMRMIESIEH